MSREEKEKENDLDPENDYDLSGSHPSDNEKRAHHNDLERKMRVQIKDSFDSLKDAIPTLHGNKSSWAKILNEASKYIVFLQENNGRSFRDIEDLRGQNAHLENQIRALETARRSGNLSSMAMSQSDLDKEDDCII